MSRKEKRNEPEEKTEHGTQQTHQQGGPTSRLMAQELKNKYYTKMAGWQDGVLTLIGTRTAKILIVKVQ